MKWEIGFDSVGLRAYSERKASTRPSGIVHVCLRAKSLQRPRTEPRFLGFWIDFGGLVWPFPIVLVCEPLVFLCLRVSFIGVWLVPFRGNERGVMFGNLEVRLRWRIESVKIYVNQHNITLRNRLVKLIIKPEALSSNKALNLPHSASWSYSDSLGADPNAKEDFLFHSGTWYGARSKPEGFS